MYTVKPKTGLQLSIVMLLLAAVFFVPPVSAQEAPVKIAVVNLDYVVANSPGGKALQARLEQFQQQVIAEAGVIQNQARDIRQRIADGANTLSEDTLADLQRQFEDKQVSLSRLQDDKQREGQKMQTEGLQEIEKQLEPVFRQIRDEENYDLILNNVPGVVVMVGERVDLTQKVLDRLGATGS